MSTLPVANLIDSIVILFSEAYYGPPDPKAGTWFIDNHPDAAILPMLAGVSAAEASLSVDARGKPGTTIASHTEHLRWSLANVNATLRGAAYNPDWSASWKVLAVDDQQWVAMRQSLGNEVDTLLEAVKKQTVLQGEVLNGLIALVPHAAYHLATIRQMIERAQAGQS